MEETNKISTNKATDMDVGPEAAGSETCPGVFSPSVLKKLADELRVYTASASSAKAEVTTLKFKYSVTNSPVKTLKRNQSSPSLRTKKVIKKNTRKRKSKLKKIIINEIDLVEEIPAVPGKIEPIDYNNLTAAHKESLFARVLLYIETGIYMSHEEITIIQNKMIAEQTCIKNKKEKKNNEVQARLTCLTPAEDCITIESDEGTTLGTGAVGIGHGEFDPTPCPCCGLARKNCRRIRRRRCSNQLGGALTVRGRRRHARRRAKNSLKSWPWVEEFGDCGNIHECCRACCNDCYLVNGARTDSALPSAAGRSLNTPQRITTVGSSTATCTPTSTALNPNFGQTDFYPVMYSPNVPNLAAPIANGTLSSDNSLVVAEARSIEAVIHSVASRASTSVFKPASVDLLDGSVQRDTPLKEIVNSDPDSFYELREKYSKYNMNKIWPKPKKVVPVNKKKIDALMKKYL